jgi:hypothetical protein
MLEGRGNIILRLLTYINWITLAVYLCFMPMNNYEVTGMIVIVVTLVTLSEYTSMKAYKEHVIEVLKTLKK